MNNLFEKATRKGYRFPSTNGLLTTEDLWKLPLIHPVNANLNAIAVELDEKIEKKSKKNFIEDELQVDQESIDKLEIVKHIIGYKKAVAQRAEQAAATKARNQQIMQIIEQKQNDALSNKSIAQLKKLMEQGGSDIDIDE